MTAVQARALKEWIEGLDGEGRYDDAMAAFETLAALDLHDDDIRLAFAEGACELAYELAATKRDRATAEAVYARLRATRERFPDDHDLIRLQAYAAAALSGLCDVQKDWTAAGQYAVAINHLNRDVPSELADELALLYGRASANLVVALVDAEQWEIARPIVYRLRELLLSDSLLSAIAEQQGSAYAADLRGLFEAMIDALRDAHPDDAAAFDTEIAEQRGAPIQEPARAERDHVEEHYDFEALKDVTFDGFLSMRVPARWPEARTEEGRGGFWEEDVESGTLWIDWDLFTVPRGGRAADAARDMAQDYEGAVLEVGEDGDLGVIRLRRETVETGQPLIIHTWHILKGRGQQILLLHFNLVILADLAEREDFRPLPDLIAREIRAARIDLARIPRGAD